VREPLVTVVPPAVFAAAVLVLGVWVPQPVVRVIAAAARQLGVS
jgi:hypothetical protein